mgnify:FL=1|jgi:hypothetical protein
MENGYGLDALIKALQIFRKYGNPQWPTHCEHDTLYIADIDPDEVSADDIEELEELGFLVDEDGEGGFISYRFGSA